MNQAVVKVAIGALIESRNGEPRLLITRRPRKAILGGLWELPGGKAKPGETSAACLVREFAEEVGLTVLPGARLSVITHRYDHATVQMEALLCSRLAGEPANLGVAEHRWVGSAELSDYRFPEANTALMAAIAERMKSM